MQTIKDLWNGEVPLIITFWFYNVFANILLSAPIYYLEYTWTPNDFYENRSFLYLYIFLTLIYAILILVALWRSATNYSNEQKNKGKYWGGISKFLVIIGALRIVADMSTFLTGA